MCQCVQWEISEIWDLKETHERYTVYTIYTQYRYTVYIYICVQYILLNWWLQLTVIANTIPTVHTVTNIEKQWFLNLRDYIHKLKYITHNNCAWDYWIACYIFKWIFKLFLAVCTCLPNTHTITTKKTQHNVLLPRLTFFLKKNLFQAFR